jgi:hypothetical protein
MSHCWHPHFENQVPVEIDLATGAARRVISVTRTQDMAFPERCCRCGARRMRSWAPVALQDHPGTFDIRETTAPDLTPCRPT